MTPITKLREPVEFVLSQVQPTVDRARERAWDQDKDGFLPIVQRAVLVRQHEFMRVILHLVSNELGYSGVCLLRPAIEELIWSSYLIDIDKAIAGNLIRLMGNLEMYDSLKAEHDYTDGTLFKKMGLHSYYARSQAARPSIRRALALIGQSLKWEKRTISNQQLPSMQWLASKTNLTKEYNYLYHATSRYVHFSSAELLRRAWGNREKLSISSDNFSSYWSAFALRWGFWIYTHTYLSLAPVLEVDGIAEPDVDEEPILAAFQKIADFGHVPIITPEELAPMP